MEAYKREKLERAVQILEWMISAAPNNIITEETQKLIVRWMIKNVD
jgi:hypothetical protein